MSQQASNATTNGTFHPVGDMTIYTALDHKTKLMSALACAENLEINLIQVGEIDTAGLQLLILAHLESTRRGIPLRLAGCSPAAREALDLCNLSGIFRNAETATSQNHSGEIPA